jgi:hypothetical protein
MEYPSEKKMTETLNHVLRIMMQFPVIFFSDGYFHPETKKIYSFLNLTKRGIKLAIDFNNISTNNKPNQRKRNLEFSYADSMLL